MSKIVAEEMEKVNGGSLLSELGKELSSAPQIGAQHKFNIGDKVKIPVQPWLGTGIVYGMDYNQGWYYDVLIDNDHYTFHEYELALAE